MFNGTQSSNSGTYTPKTGIAAFEIIAINPTKEEIEQLIGREYPLTVDYSIVELNERRVRPVHIWVRSEEANITETIRFYVSTDVKVAQSGSIRFVNTKGQFKYAASAADLKTNYPDWGEFREATEGEFELYSFIQRLIRYKPSSSDAQFMKDIEASNMTVRDLYDGNFKGIRSLIDYAKENKCFIGLVLAVKPKDKTNENGTVTRQYRQVVLSKPDTFFTLYGGKVTDYPINKLEEIYKESVERGYPLTNDLFTYKLQNFKLEDCVNNAPEANDAQGYPSSWGV